MSLEEGWAPDPRYADPAFRMTFARVVTHYFHHRAWLADGQLLRDAHRLAGIPGVLVHGRFDIGGPPDTPWQLARAWAGAELYLVRTGHGGGTDMTTCIMDATNRFAAGRVERAGGVCRRRHRRSHGVRVRDAAVGHNRRAGLPDAAHTQIAGKRGRRGGRPRYRMLETVRQYALERLHEIGQATEIRERHATWFLELAELAEPELRGAEQMVWLDRLEHEYGNLRLGHGLVPRPAGGRAGAADGRCTVEVLRGTWPRARG